jgi:hypothetical protein
MTQLSHQSSVDGFGSAEVARQLSAIDSDEEFHPIRPRYLPRWRSERKATPAKEEGSRQGMHVPRLALVMRCRDWGRRGCRGSHSPTDQC